MKTSKNYNLGTNKFFNIVKGAKDNKFIFCFPSLIISPKHYLYWDTVMFSIFFVWGKYFIQFNICEIVKNTSTEVFKETLISLTSFLKTCNLEIIDKTAILNYLNKNPYITQVIKNANLEHPYVKTILTGTFQNQPFIKNK